MAQGGVHAAANRGVGLESPVYLTGAHILRMNKVVFTAENAQIIFFGNGGRGCDSALGGIFPLEGPISGVQRIQIVVISPDVQPAFENGRRSANLILDLE